MPIARRVGPIKPAIIFVVAMRTPQGLHSDSTAHPSTLEELQYQSLPGPLWVLFVQKRPSGSVDASWLRLGGNGSSFSAGLSPFRSGSASDEDSGQQRTAVYWRQTMPSSPP